eukprot:5050725-Prymnesium_polylepis.1
MWVVTRAARYRLWVAGACGPIKGSPYDVECLPAALSVTHSQLRGVGSTDAAAGAATRFELEARDVFDNPLRRGAFQWAAALSSPSTVVPVRQLTCPTTGCGATYFFEYNTTRAGSYELLVGAPGADGTVNGSLQVQNTPAAVTVRAGPLSGPASKVFGPTAADAADGGAGGAGVVGSEGAGRPVRLWIEARDAHGNAH